MYKALGASLDATGTQSASMETSFFISFTSSAASNTCLNMSTRKYHQIAVQMCQQEMIQFQMVHLCQVFLHFTRPCV